MSTPAEITPEVNEVREQQPARRLPARMALSILPAVAMMGGFSQRFRPGAGGERMDPLARRQWADRFHLAPSEAAQDAKRAKAGAKRERKRAARAGGQS